MLARIRKYLSTPIQPISRVPLIEALYYAAAVYAILVIMRPFGIDEASSACSLLPYAAITYIGVIFPYAIVRLCRPTFFDMPQWTNGRDMLMLCVVVLCIAGGNISYMAASTGELSPRMCIDMLWQTAAIAVGVSGIKLYRRNRLLQRNLREAQQLNLQLQSIANQSNTANGNATITIEGTGKKDECRLVVDRLLYVESERNYCRLVYVDDNRQVVETLIRATLASVGEQLSEHGNIARVHRAFLVNLRRVEAVEGNSAGCRLMLCGGRVVVPVARSYASQIIERLRK